jgi:myo-inositol-1(or 4)-monophosphatase
MDPRFLQAATEAADRAGAIIRPHFRANLATERKSDESPVTLADRAAEQDMRHVLAAHFPSHGILGEEYGLENPDAPFRWVLDPIDGTRAFITGRPVFGTLIALLHEDTPILGIIDQPVTGERWIGIAGEKTRFSGPFGGRAGTRSCPTLSAAELSCTSPDMLGVHDRAWRRLAGAAARVSWGGDCYAYGLLALGQIDIIAECDMKIWDFAALQPVIDGAGGRLTNWSGDRLGNSHDGRVLAVGDPALLAPAVALLTEAAASGSGR